MTSIIVQKFTDSDLANFKMFANLHLHDMWTNILCLTRTYYYDVSVFQMDGKLTKLKICSERTKLNFEITHKER